MRKLRALLVAIGFVATGVLTLPLLRVKDDVTLGELRDAGLQDCDPAQDMLCDVRLSDDLAAQLAAAGRGNGRNYYRLAIDVRQCGQRGIVITDQRLYSGGKWRDGVTVVDGSCSISEAAQLPDDSIVRTVNQDCACRAATGNCRYTLPDGGVTNIPFGITAGPPTLVGGLGCVRKSCVTIAGATDDSWPAECPGG